MTVNTGVAQATEFTVNDRVASPFESVRPETVAQEEPIETADVENHG